MATTTSFPTVGLSTYSKTTTSTPPFFFPSSLSLNSTPTPPKFTLKTNPNNALFTRPSRTFRNNSTSFVVRCQASGGRITQEEFTEMAGQAIVSSPEVAKENKHQIAETEHLFKALLEQKNGLARRIFSKAAVDNTRLLEATDKFINLQPKVLGESAGSMLGPDLESLVQRARDYKKEYNDSFVSVEHLVLGYVEDRRFGKQLCKDFQISLKALKNAIETIRGRQTVIDKAANRLIFAYYVTGHGFGHATRVTEVVRNLILAGHDVHVVTGAPDFLFMTEIQSPRLILRKVLLDCGAVQADALTVDRLASLEKYSETAVAPRDSILKTEVEWLHSIKADLVVSDVVPVVCRAAADAGIRSVCVTNFSWDFIYAEYVMAAGYDHRSIVWQIAEDYSHCEFLIRLPGYCPMPAFRDVIDVPLVVRRLHKPRKEVRKELGIADDVKLVILNFGGQPAGWKLKEESLPSGWLCLVCGSSDNQVLPPNFIKLAKDVYTPDYIAASDCMLGKIGYGTVSEALAYKVPFVFVRRDYFNEEPFLRNMLEYYQGGVEMIRRDLLTGQWRPYLEHAVTLKPCYEGGCNGGEVAARILQDTAIGKNYASDMVKSQDTLPL